MTVEANQAKEEPSKRVTFPPVHPGRSPKLWVGPPPAQMVASRLSGPDIGSPRAGGTARGMTTSEVADAVQRS